MRNPPDPRLEKWRRRFGVYDGCHGSDGAFIIPFDNKTRLSVISSSGGGWEHVSVSPFHKRRTPTWEEMNFVKGIFWGPEETVIQFHPPEQLYINNHKYVLHLWRPIGVPLPFPPLEMVGILGLGPDEAEREALAMLKGL